MVGSDLACVGVRFAPDAGEGAGDLLLHPFDKETIRKDEKVSGTENAIRFLTPLLPLCGSGPHSDPSNSSVQ
jgi:hypothetical protein